MSNNELEILLTLRDKATAKLKKFRSVTKGAAEAMKKHWLALAASITLVIIAIKKAVTAIISMAKELVRVNSQMEDFRTRIGVVAGSLLETNKIFKDMKDLAASVPQTFEQVMEAATNLTAVVKGGSEDVKALMPIILDLSAATGIAVTETTGQIIRMYSAGAASADMFRERGVLAALGFQAGVSYTNEETMRILTEQWEDGTSRYIGATDKMAKTWTGITSMMQDAWREFKEVVGAKAFEAVKTDMRIIVRMFNEAKEEGDEYDSVVEKLSETFEKLYEKAREFVRVAIEGGGQLLDTYNEIDVVVKGLVSTWMIGIQQILSTMELMSKFTLAGQLLDKEAIFAANEEIKENIYQMINDIAEARTQADIDYSEQAKATLEDLFAKYVEIKEGMLIVDQEIAAASAAVEATAVGQKLSYWKEYNEARVAIEDKINKDMEQSIKSSTKKIETAFAHTFAEIIKGNMSAKEAFAELGKQMIDILIDFVAQQIVQMTLSMALGQIMSLFVSAEAAALATAWAPAAALASLATLGGNATPAGIGLATTTSLAMGLAQVPTATAAMTSATTGLAVPAMAEGGIVTRPTLALIGEAGPEAVIPLSRGGGQQVINIEINNPVVDSSDSIDLLTEEISNRLAIEMEKR